MVCLHTWTTPARSHQAPPGWAPLPSPAAMPPLPSRSFPAPSPRLGMDAVLGSENVGIWCPLVAAGRVTAGRRRRDPRSERGCPPLGGGQRGPRSPGLALRLRALSPPVCLAPGEPLPSAERRRVCGFGVNAGALLLAARCPGVASPASRNLSCRKHLSPGGEGFSCLSLHVPSVNQTCLCPKAL